MAQPTPAPIVHVGDVVWANAAHVSGLPYRAKVEDLRDGKAKVRPLARERVLTAGSARSEGPSVRARWVDARWLEKTDPA